MGRSQKSLADSEVDEHRRHSIADESDIEEARRRKSDAGSVDIHASG